MLAFQCLLFRQRTSDRCRFGDAAKNQIAMNSHNMYAIPLFLFYFGFLYCFYSVFDGHETLGTSITASSVAPSYPSTSASNSWMRLPMSPCQESGRDELPQHIHYPTSNPFILASYSFFSSVFYAKRLIGQNFDRWGAIQCQALPFQGYQQCLASLISA